MDPKRSEFWRGWGNKLKQQLHVICGIMRSAERSQGKGNDWGMWEGAERTLKGHGGVL